MPGLLYATPSGGNPHAGYVLSVRALELTCTSYGVRQPKDFQIVQAPVQMARSKIGQHAVDKDYDFVLMHDDDMAIAPQPNYGNALDVWHRIMDADPKVGVIGAVYMRERPVIPNVVIQHPQHSDELCHVVCGFPPGPVEVGAIGTGFMLIRTSVLRELLDLDDGPLFRFHLRRTKWGNMAEVGEDYDFCQRVRKLGYKIIADPRVDTTHFKDRGPLVYQQARWEAAWGDGPGRDQAVFDELKEHCSPAFRVIQANGFMVIDHVPQLEFEAKERAKALAKKAA
jgi:hypothetical protein